MGCVPRPVHLGERLKSAILFLTARGVPSPRMNAELLLMFTLGCDRAYLYGHRERELTSEELSAYERALAERAQGVPAQYITGHQEFWGLDLIVSPAVLIPRPETEHVVETALDLLGVAAPRTATVRVVDVGTGSGCIALALAKELPEVEIHATERSKSALEVAQVNAARHQLEKRIQFHETDLLRGLPQSHFDLVVSNPPYVGEREEDAVQLEVRRFEPREAVFAGPNGTEVIARLVEGAAEVLRPGGCLAVEISGTIAAEARELVRGWQNVRVRPDLQSIPRVLSARKP
jgi:release factor glutamine methyltransferase